MTTEATKQCRTCDLIKPLSDFYNQASGDGYTPRCRECIKGSQVQRERDRAAAGGVEPPASKRCPRCSETRSSSFFYRDLRKHDGLSSYCKGCFSDIAKERTYGMDPGEYEQMLIAQSGRCACCEDELRDPHLDHDHESGRVRAILCRSCNLAEGFLRTPERAMRLAIYMEHHDQLT